MCSIIIINHHQKDFPLIVAANRDEDYNRPTSKVQILSKEPHIIIGGKDELKGGTWLGVNKYSIFAAITNQGDKDEKLESRGKIVMDALKCSSIEEILNFVENINPSKFNKFNLVFGNQNVVFVAYSYLLHSMVIRELPKGINVITNDMIFVGDIPKINYIHKKLDAVSISVKNWVEYYSGLKSVLNYYGDGLGLKVKPKKKKTGEIYGHCTVSSSILTFDNNGLARYKYYDRTEPRPKKKEGEPIQPRYKDYIDLWRGEDGSSRASEEKDEVEDGETEEPSDEKLNYFLNKLISKARNFDC